MSEPENPLVFPQDIEHRIADDEQGLPRMAVRRHGGMTLRDYFAAQLIRSYGFGPPWNPTGLEPTIVALSAECAYIIADAMLVARQQKEPAKP